MLGEQERGESTIDSRRAWGVAAGAFLSLFTVFGVVYSFGEFFGPMADEFGTNRSKTAMFFSITTFTYFVLGLATGRLADRVGQRKVLLMGSGAMVAGLFLTSKVSSLEMGYVTYGAGVGFGVACCFVPMVAGVGGWFERQRTLALGVAVSGIGVGTLAVVPFSEWLIAEYGWRTAYQILAALTAALLLLSAVLAHRPPTSGVAPEPLSKTVRGRSDFWILYGSSFLLSGSLFMAFVFMADFVSSESVDGSAAVLLGIIGISSVVGRLLLGILGARMPVERLLLLSSVGLSVSFGVWATVGSSYLGLIVFSILLGISYGGIIAISPAVVAHLFGTLGMGGVLGALYTANGLGGLIGPPALGALIDSSGYLFAQIIAGATAAIGALILLFLPKSAHSARS